MPSTGRNEDGVSGPDLPGVPVDFHDRGSFEDEIDLLAKPVKVAGRCSARLKCGLGETLVLNGGIGEVEEAPYRRAVCGREGLLGVERVYNHPDRSRLE